MSHQEIATTPRVAASLSRQRCLLASLQPAYVTCSFPCALLDSLYRAMLGHAIGHSAGTPSACLVHVGPRLHALSLGLLETQG